MHSLDGAPLYGGLGLVGVISIWPLKPFETGTVINTNITDFNFTGRLH